MQVRELVNSWIARALSQSEYYRDFGGIVKFVIEGEGGGRWLFDLRGRVEVHETDEEGDCAITISALDLLEVSSGRLNPQSAFRAGRIQVAGDAILALRALEIMEGSALGSYTRHGQG